MPRLVRRNRAPLTERISTFISDILLTLSEELNSHDWEEFAQEWATPVGIVLNVVFMVAKANAGHFKSSNKYDVFGDYQARKASGWLSYFVKF